MGDNGAMPGQPNGQPESPFIAHTSGVDSHGGRLRMPSRSPQPLPGLLLPLAPPVAFTGPGAGAGVAITVVVTGGGLGSTDGWA